jgi:hypothetical protein
MAERMLVLLQNLAARYGRRNLPPTWAPGVGGASGATDYLLQVVGFVLGKVELAGGRLVRKGKVEEMSKAKGTDRCR